jgi:hypothetical protein
MNVSAVIFPEQESEADESISGTKEVFAEGWLPDNAVAAPFAGAKRNGTVSMPVKNAFATPGMTDRPASFPAAFPERHSSLTVTPSI